MKKRWSLTDYQAEAIRRLLDRALELCGEGSSALTTWDGTPLHVRSRHPADTATLPAAAHQCQQYLRLADGDVAILNDPFSGGTRLSDVTLVAGVSFETNEPCELLIAHRIAFPPRISIEGKLDDEGVRLPPMPLISQGSLNREILAAVAAAPQAPPDLTAAIEAGLDGLARTRRFLKACGRDPQSDLRKANFKTYVEANRDAVHHWVARLPLGETSISTRLEGGELLKLRLEVVDDKVIFDFTGTEPSTRVQLTDLATFGACFRTIEAVLERSIPENAGSFQHVQVLAPARTWVNAKAPAATSIGVSDGLAAIAQLGQKGFGKLSSNHLIGGSGYAASRLRFDFHNGACFSDATPGGSGAQQATNGADGHSTWLESETRALSIERCEREFPVQIRAVVLRPGSGGKGKSSGGLGLVKTYSVLAPARLSWALEHVHTKPEGADGGKSGMTAELTLLRSGENESQTLPPNGHVDLLPGDLVHLHTAGGGGYGAPPED